MPESVQHDRLVNQAMKSGTNGSPVELIANFFRLETTGLDVLHYDIEIKKARRNDVSSSSSTSELSAPQPMTSGAEFFIRKFTPKILEHFFASNPDISQNVPFVHDGARNMYAAKKLNLPAMPVTLSINIDGRVSEFTVKLTQVGQVNLSEVDHYYGKQVANISENVFAVYDLILRFVIGKFYTSYQHSFYDLSQKQHSPNVKLFDFVPGFISSVKMTEFGLALNLHLKTACVISSHYKGCSLDQFVQDVTGTTDLKSLDKWKIKEASKMLRFLKVKTTHTTNPRIFTVDRIIESTPYEYQFDQQNGDGKISVSDYFLQQYGIPLKGFPLVRTTTSSRGGQEKIVLPMEVCQLVEDQFIADQKMDHAVQAEMITKAKHDPNVYFNKVKSFVEKIAQIDPQLLQAFEIKLTTKAVKLSGRQLPLPRILDGNRTFHKVAKAPSWALFCFDDSCNKGDGDNFIKLFRGHAKERKLDFDMPILVLKISIKEMAEIGNNICLKLKKIKHVDFLVVVTPPPEGMCYFKIAIVEINICQF